MYREFYGFKEKPFNITPNPRFIFLSKNHREAFAHLLYGIDNHAGFIELTGEVGTGKTTVLRSLLGQLDDDTHRIALILNPCLSAVELLRSINREYGLPADNLSVAELLDTLNHFLLKESAQGHTVVLVIDEAQNLETQVLEQIRLISNLETETDKLIQIVLAGQPELGQVLEQSELRQLSQRITVRYHLLPMDYDDTLAYIEHRLEVAGGWRAATFTPGAVKRIYRYSGGFPRLINIVCDRALLIGYTEGSREISALMVASAIREVRRTGKVHPISHKLRIAAVCLLALIVAAGIYAFSRHLTKSPTSADSAVSMSSSVTPATPDAETRLTAIRKDLAALGESESALTGFNALAHLLDARPVVSYRGKISPRALERLAKRRGLRLTPFAGSPEELLRTGAPALLEFTLPGVDGKRFLALTGSSSGQLSVAPPLKGIGSLTTGELKGLWSGRAYLLWNNFLNIPTPLKPGTGGAGVARTQELLRDRGFYKREPDGVFDTATIAAVKGFQSAHGITPDGVVGDLTLIALYRAGGKFSHHSTTRKGNNDQL